MASNYPTLELPPKVLTYGLLVSGLAAIVYAIVTQKILIAFAIMGAPMGFLILAYSVRNPRFAYLLYATYSYYMTAIMRYSRQDGLSVVLDILLVFMALCIVFNISSKRTDIHLANAVNYLTVGYVVWILFILMEFLNPLTHHDQMIFGVRVWILGIPVLYIISSLLADKPKMLKKGLIILGVFTITAFLKLLYQKYRWFDAAEAEWLMAGGWVTHILSTGIRYFSIFSDAGNFGANMGMIAIVYSIVSFNTPKKWLRVFYLMIAIMGVIGMFMSGTRGAIVIPFGGLILYCLLSKSFKIMLISAFAGIILYSFFAFTDIGNENGFIRRMRTAFRPTEDSSFNVRVENQKKIGIYLATHPWGAGLGKGVPRTMLVRDVFVDDNIPPDSFFVNIWMQTGFVGLILYIAIYSIVLLRCCYLIMFRVKNKELRHTLAALLCGVFGIWLNGYVGRGMGMPPNNFLIAAALAFVLNGPYMDRQITENEMITHKTEPQQ